MADRVPGECDSAEVAILVDPVELVVMRAVFDERCRVVSLEGRLAGDLEQRNGGVGAEQRPDGVTRFRPPLAEALEVEWREKNGQRNLKSRHLLCRKS